MTDTETPANVVDAPYRSFTIGTRVLRYITRGPGVYIVCESLNRSQEIAAALNAAFMYGVLSERSKR